MQVDVNVLRLEVLEEVVGANALTPVTAGAALEAIGEPKAVVYRMSV